VERLAGLVLDVDDDALTVTGIDFADADSGAQDHCAVGGGLEWGRGRVPVPGQIEACDEQHKQQEEAEDGPWPMRHGRILTLRGGLRVLANFAVSGFFDRRRDPNRKSPTPILLPLPPPQHRRNGEDQEEPEGELDTPSRALLY